MTDAEVNVAPAIVPLISTVAPKLVKLPFVTTRPLVDWLPRLAVSVPNPVTVALPEPVIVMIFVDET